MTDRYAYPDAAASGPQLAKAARATVDQIDIVELFAHRADSAGSGPSRDVDAVALVKFSEVVKGLAVTVVAGKDFPVADPTGGDPFVTLRLRPRPAGAGRARAAARAPGMLPPAGDRPSLMSKLAQHAVHQTRTRGGALRGPLPRFGDRFDFVLYDENQVLFTIERDISSSCQWLPSISCTSSLKL